MKSFRFKALCLVFSLISVAVYAQTADDATSLVKQAVQLNNQGKYADAVDKYTQALKLEPDNMSANYGIAFSLLQSDKAKDGIPYLEKVIKANGSLTAYAYDLLGSIYDKSHESAKAIEAFNAGIKTDPKYQRLYYNLSLVYFRDKNYAEAEKCVIQSIKMDPKHANSQRIYALVCFHQNKRASALLGLCSFILLEPATTRSAEAYGNIQHILQGGVLKQDANTPALMTDANNIALNNAITLQTGIAGKKTYPTPADQLAAQLTAIFNAIGPMTDKQTGNDFFKNYYAEFFYKMAQSPNMKAFAHLISQSVPENAEWIKNNAGEMTALDNWVKNTERSF